MQRPQRWRATPRTVFQVATTENRDLHLSVLSLFADRDLTDPALTLEEILRALPDQAPDLAVEQDLVRRSLDQLVEWALLDESRNESAVYRTPEEFQRRNLQWALTDHGQTAVAALDAAAEFLAAVANLHPAAIDSLAQSIARVVSLAADPGSDSAAIDVEWQQVELHHHSLVDNVRQFQRRLAQLLRDPTLSDTVMAQARDAIIEYLTRYIHDAERPASRAADALRRLHELGPNLVFERAVEGARIAPDPVFGDPTPAWLEERERHLAGLDEWFYRTADGSAPRMARLRAQGRDWILQFLRVLELRRAHRRRSAGIIDDFVSVARAFAACSTDDDAHRIFVAAFELHGARHHDLAHDDAEPIDTASPAIANPAVELTAQLRVRPSTSRTSRERAVMDPTIERARAAARQARAAKEMLELRRGVLSDGTVRLSEYGRLEIEPFRELVDLLCAALTSLPDPDGTRRAVSVDGYVEVVVHRLDTDELCELVTDVGKLHVPDFRVSIRLRDQVAHETDTHGSPSGSSSPDSRVAAPPALASGS